MATKVTLAEVVAKSAKAVEDAEKRVINAAIAEAKTGKVALGDIAETVGVSYVTLRKRMKDAGFDPEVKRGRKSAFSAEDQAKLVERVVNGEDRTTVAAEAGVREGTLYSWQKKLAPETIATRKVETEVEDVTAEAEADAEVLVEA